MPVFLANNKKLRLWSVLVTALLLAVPTIVNGAGLEDFQAWLSDNYRTEFNGFIEARGGSRLQLALVLLKALSCWIWTIQKIPRQRLMPILS